MPIYEYAAVEGGCAECADRFEAMQRLADDALTVCPACGTAVRRVYSAPGVVSGKRHLLDPKNVAAKGLTQYRRNGKGHYEKTTGSGPSELHA